MDELGPPLRVLVTAYASVPGANPHASAVASMALGLRAQVDVVSVLSEHQAHVERHLGAQLFRVPLAGSARERRAGFSRAVRRQLEASVYDVVHVRGPHEGLVAAELRDTLGYRLVYEVATFPDEAEGAEAEREWLEAHRACLEAADLVLVPTEAAARALAEEGHAGKTAVVYPAVDVDTYDWWPSAPSRALRILYLGSFASDRDLPTLLAALRRFGRQHPVRALLAGEPDPAGRARLRQLVEAFDLAGRVEVRGEPRRDRVASLVASCDLAVVPAAAVPRFQEHGDLPQPILEYMACRRLVVATAVPAVAEVARDEQEAYLYPPGEEEALAEMLFLAAADRDRAEAVAERARERARARFSAAARRRRIAEVYEMLVPGSQRFDAWREGFEEEGTSEHDIGPGPGASRPEPSGASIALPDAEGVAEPSGASIPLAGVEEGELPVSGTGTLPGAREASGSATEELPAESTLPGSGVGLDTDPLGRDEEVEASTIAPPSESPTLDTAPGVASELPAESTVVEARASESRPPAPSVPPPAPAARRAVAPEGHSAEPEGG